MEEVNLKTEFDKEKNCLLQTFGWIVLTTFIITFTVQSFFRKEMWHFINLERNIHFQLFISVSMEDYYYYYY